MKICAVFGHRQIDCANEIKVKLVDVIKRLIKDGVDTFYFGGLGQFDELCHSVVSELKEQYCNVKRVFCLYDERHVRESKRPKWLKDDDFEEFVFLPLKFAWWYKKIYYRNCAMIDDSDVALFYVKKRENSGAYKTLKYAKKSKKTIINLFNNT